MIAVRIVIAVNDPLYLLVLLVVQILTNLAGGRGDEQQRLLAGGHTVGDDVVQLPPVLPLVNLVEQRAMNVEAVQRVAVGGQRLEYAVVVVAGDLADERPHTLEQRRGLLHHALCLGPDDFSLVSLGSDCIDLRAGLRIGKLHVQAYRRGEQALAVLLADDQDRLAVLAVALDVDEAEHRREHRFFPKLKLNELTAELALGVPAVVLDELDHVVSAPRVVEILRAFSVHAADYVPVGPVDLLRDDFLPALDFRPVLAYRGESEGIRPALCHGSSRPVTKLPKPSSSLLPATAGSMESSCRMIFW